MASITLQPPVVTRGLGTRAVMTTRSTPFWARCKTHNSDLRRNCEQLQTQRKSRSRNDIVTESLTCPGNGTRLLWPRTAPSPGGSLNLQQKPRHESQAGTTGWIWRSVLLRRSARQAPLALSKQLACRRRPMATPSHRIDSGVAGLHHRPATPRCPPMRQQMET